MRRFWKILVTVLAVLAVCLGVLFWMCRPERSQTVAEVEPAASQDTVPATLPEQTEPEQLQTLPAEEVPEAPTGFDTVPQYFQTDYPYIKYGNGTIATSGCSVTCLAMVASYLTGWEYRPDELAYHFGSFGKNNIERLEHATEEMQLPCEKNCDWQQTLQALREGKVAIVMMNERSDFTTEQHFIVLAGLTEDGKILVNDPNRDNYTNQWLKDGFENGFESYAIVRGFGGAWVYDKSAMPEEPFLYDASKPQQEESRYLGYELPEEDIYTLACFAWVEAREESELTQQAVLEVILNRVVSPDFPNTVQGVIHQGELYNVTGKLASAQPELAQYRAVTAAMYGPYQLPIDVYYYSRRETGGQDWGTLEDLVFLYQKEG